MNAAPSSRDRLERSLARIADPSAEGTRTFLGIYSDAAREAADAADKRLRNGTMLGPLDGAIVSIKDLFDVAGETTKAGSTTLNDAPAALSDAPVVHRLRRAGAVIVGKTNMSEFAFTGVGANPHYGTPRNPADRTRVPGGSSSGAAVSVADDMCEIAIGTDTGGSTRIPAALCGLVGYKPTKERVPTAGAFPLSGTLDSVGPLASSVQACADADAVLAGEEPWTLEPVGLGGLRLGVLEGIPLEELDEGVAARFDDALAQVEQAGVHLSGRKFGLLNDMARLQSAATIATVEAYQIHRDRIAARGQAFDPIIRRRIETGAAVSSEAYATMLEERSELVSAMDSQLAGLDALVLPTTPIVAPTMAEISDPRVFSDKNRLLLRNTAIANFFDLCAISLPMLAVNALPAGLMLFGRRLQDRRLFNIAASIEPLLGR